MSLAKGQVYYFSTAGPPYLEIQRQSGRVESLAFKDTGQGRELGETCWLVEPDLPVSGEPWRFRVKLSGALYDSPPEHAYYTTRLRRLWLQDNQIYGYRPAASVSPSQVIKIPKFTGRLSPRALYIYLPRGYTEHTSRQYPVLYMHDGQNCFEAYVGDSFAGSWRADKTADWLIGQGRMQECLIVGVSNADSRRNIEYLPPYSRYLMGTQKKGKVKDKRAEPVFGTADQTLAYYRDDVAAFIERQYRVLKGRKHTATCGSSMGGVFSTYIAWEHPEFARHHAILSPAYWVTRTEQGALETVERLRTGSPRDIRLWLDSGTLDAPGKGDDGMLDTRAACDALLENGYVKGHNFRYYLANDATHSESAWAARLHLVFQFLFPPLN